jgi:hypothetical protein
MTFTVDPGTPTEGDKEITGAANTGSLGATGVKIAKTTKRHMVFIRYFIFANGKPSVHFLST